jgi:DNA gyrase subunit A
MKSKDGFIKDVSFLSISKELYTAYSTEVIEDRAIFCTIDGLKPVTRRVLWAAHKLGLRANARRLKAAKVVGDTMGDYHPHGDSSIYNAIVTANSLPIPLFSGEGNWGTMTDPPAAMRYTETRLSKFADKVFFDPFYLPVMDSVDNYDDSKKEPFVLNALLPNALLNGNFGIAPGVRTQAPSFSLVSVAKVLVETLKAGTCTPAMCLPLRFTTDLGGVMRQYKGIKKDLLDFYRNGYGKFIFDSTYTVVNKSHIRFTRFAPISSVGNTLDKVLQFKGVTRTMDESNKDDKYNAYGVVGKMSDARLVEKVVDAFSAAVSFDVKVTERIISEEHPHGKKSLLPTNVPDMVNIWIKYRIDLEKRACIYWITRRKQEIRYLEIMRIAVANRKLIIQALDKPFDDEQLANYLAKKLKITVFEANQILDLKVRSLKALEDKKLATKIKELKQEVSGYEGRVAKPKKYIANHIVDLVKTLQREVEA